MKGKGEASASASLTITNDEPQMNVVATNKSSAFARWLNSRNLGRPIKIPAGL